MALPKQHEALPTSSFRIQKDLKEIHEASWGDAPPIMACPVDDRLSHVAALVLGPPETPYEHGFFMFDLKYLPNYPNEPPLVKLLSTSEGRVRMNPNLYADGKVCLSILGTWRGETAESWRSTYSTLYVLQALQCIVMNSEPYHNEPGFEKQKADRGIYFSAIVPHSKPKTEPQAQAQAEAEAQPSKTQDQPPTGSPSGSPTTVEQPLTVSTPIHDMCRVVVSKEQIALDRAHYSLKIAHETIRVTVCDVLEALLQIATEPVPYVSQKQEESEQPQRSALQPQLFQPMYSAVSVEHFTTNRTTLLASTHVGIFAAQIKRFFLMHYQQYVERCTSADAAAVEGTNFRLMTFELGRNSCPGAFMWQWLLRRLHAIRAALDAETDAWLVKGRELTARNSYLASVLRDDVARLAEFAPGVSGGLMDDDNVYAWSVTMLMSDGLYEEGIYKVEIVFNEDLSQPPRIRFVQPIWHPNISPDGIPFTLHWENSIQSDRRYSPSALLPNLYALLLDKGALGNQCTWLNTAAGKQCFGKPEGVKAFKSRARQLSRRSAET